MMQQTLKTLRRWLPAVLFLGLLVPHAAADIPAEVLRTANTWAFLATMAVRCDTHLEWRGYAGVHEDVCVDFLAQYKQASDAWATTTAQFSQAATAAETSQSPAAALKWDTFLQGFQASVNHVSNTLGRLESLRQAKTKEAKKAPRRRQK
jgi:hypothetical protein